MKEKFYLLKLVKKWNVSPKKNYSPPPTIARRCESLWTAIIGKRFTSARRVTCVASTNFGRAAARLGSSGRSTASVAKVKKGSIFLGFCVK
jgi:hypothetical protein